MKNTAGFTLIETMTVLAVVAIMMAIAFPAILSWFPNLRFRSATRDLFSNIQMAKLEAIKRNEPVVIQINDLNNANCSGVPRGTTPVPNPGGGYTIYVDDGSGAGGVAGNEVQDGSEQTLVEATMPKNVALCATLPVNTDTGFSSTGIPFRALSLNVQNDNGRRADISISAAGNISIQ